MKKRFHIFCTVCVMAVMQIVSSCGASSSAPQTITAADVAEEFSSGVVLIQNKFYYELHVNGINPMYFTGLDNGEIQGFTFDINEVTPTLAWGTGFFINENGYIATNAHVADPQISAKDARGFVVNALSETADEMTNEINKITDKINIAQLALLGSSGSERRQMQAIYEELLEQRENAQNFVNIYNRLSSGDCDIKLHSDLSVAYSNTHVNKLSDFNDCVLLRSDGEHDVAIMQLKSKVTPEGRYIFEVYDDIEGDENDCPVGTQLFLVGYNHGPELAITEDGLKPQVFSGAITQNTDSKQMLYSIPTLHGSSGSPVVDEYGDLVAVNFAGLGGTQNFNYGIKVKHLSKLLNQQ
ncbi:MAG: serine protease [Muribaculaceae bacterium]|nr:serine protease [Muribaculaceae bacterium]